MSCRARQKSERESKRVVRRRRNNTSRHRQSRWLSKERGCGRGKMDRCQNKGDRKCCPDLGARGRIEGESRYEWGRTVRIEVDYTRQCTMACFTRSRTILSVFEWAVEIRSNGRKGKRKNP